MLLCQMFDLVYDWKIAFNQTFKSTDPSPPHIDIQFKTQLKVGTGSMWVEFHIARAPLYFYFNTPCVIPITMYDIIFIYYLYYNNELSAWLRLFIHIEQQHLLYYCNVFIMHSGVY